MDFVIALIVTAMIEFAFAAGPWQIDCLVGARSTESESLSTSMTVRKAVFWQAADSSVLAGSRTIPGIVLMRKAVLKKAERTWAKNVTRWGRCLFASLDKGGNLESKEGRVTNYLRNNADRSRVLSKSKRESAASPMTVDRHDRGVNFWWAEM